MHRLFRMEEVMFFKKYVFGSVAVCYVESPVEGHEGKTTIGLAVTSADLEVDPKKLHTDSLVQVAFTGDEALIDYTLGATMRNHNSTILKIQSQIADMGGVQTVLCDEKGNYYTHILCYDAAFGVFETRVIYENKSNEVRTLELLESVSISGIFSPSNAYGTEGLTLYRMTSAWSRECRLKSDAFSTLGLDTSWARYGVKVERWGQIGSMPNRGYFPFGAIGDETAKFTLGVLLEAPYSWQMQVYKEKETCALSGGIADYETGHWRKTVAPHEIFETHAAYFTVKDTLTDVCNAFVHFQSSRLRTPQSEQNMPVLFNEYCTTWGCPSEENITNILAAIEGLPVDYFVADCGWYKPDDKGWCNAIGDWRENKSLFPNGVKRIAEKIKAAGMRPGIWFEYEVAGRDSDLFQNESMLLHRDGKPITAKNRRFLDLRLPETEKYLTERLLDFMEQNGFGYIKIDYNDNYGIGCDSMDGASLGEGGRQVAECSLAWLTKLTERMPDLVIENCSSGGSRIEPKRMSLVSMCSFSDAHECAEIPLVAANVSRVIPAEQSQIWAVLREGESDSRTIYSLCAAMIGRICLSGDVLKMTPRKKALVKEGLEFYGQIKQLVKEGDIVSIDNSVEYYRRPVGRQIYIKAHKNFRLVILHMLEGCKGVEIPMEGYRLKLTYTDLSFGQNGKNFIVGGGEYQAGAFLFEKQF